MKETEFIDTPLWIPFYMKPNVEIPNIYPSTGTPPRFKHQTDNLHYMKKLKRRRRRNRLNKANKKNRRQ